MVRKLEEIFNECLERMNQGESVESCLCRYPEHAAELQVLLSTAINVRWRASRIQPDPAFKARARAQFIGAQYYAQQARQQVQAPRQTPGIFSWQRAWVPAIGTVFLVLFGSVGTAAAASNAMPDEALYPVKMATEQVQLTFAFADEDKAELNTKLAEKRSQEIATLATQGKTDYVPAVTQHMISHLEQASIAIAKVETAESNATAVMATKPAALPPAKLPPAASAPPLQPVPVTPPSQPAPVPPTPSASVPGKSADSKSGTASQETTGAATTKTTKLKELLDAAASKNVTTLQNVMEKAPETAKPALQKAIEASQDKLKQIKQDSSLHKPSSPPGTIRDTDRKPGTNLPGKPNLNRGTDKDSNNDDDNDSDGKVIPPPAVPNPVLPPKTGPVNPPLPPKTGTSSVSPWTSK
jgi:hypothetical protein